jgi:hypothetical protein
MVVGSPLLSNADAVSVAVDPSATVTLLPASAYGRWSGRRGSPDKPFGYICARHLLKMFAA